MLFTNPRLWCLMYSIQQSQVDPVSSLCEVYNSCLHVLLSFHQEYVWRVHLVHVSRGTESWVVEKVYSNKDLSLVLDSKLRVW